MHNSKGIRLFVDTVHLVGDAVFPPSADALLVRGAKPDDLKLLLAAERFPSGALLPFSHPLVRACIHEAKFHENKKAILLLGTVLRDTLSKLPSKPYTLIPVPLSRRRLRERGYNQAACIAQSAAQELPHITVHEDILQRIRNTKPQTDLVKEKRAENVAGAFLVKDPACVLGRDIILLDDVVTTGATIRAAKAALLRHRPQSVMVLALAH